MTDHPSNFGDVEAFHTKFELPVSENQPKLITQELLEFRMLFMLEELLEFIDAAGYCLTYTQRLDEPDKWGVKRINPTSFVDHEKMFDALLDEVYVAMGTAHLLGYPWQRGWNLVQNANMSKVRAQKDGSDSARSSSWDVVKPEGWTAPDIGGLLKECGWGSTCPEKHPLTGNPCVVEGEHIDHLAMGVSRLQHFGDHLKDNSDFRG